MTIRRCAEPVCWEVVDSDWLATFSPSERIVEALIGSPLRHFVVAGGDSILEVIDSRPPEAQRIESLADLEELTKAAPLAPQCSEDHGVERQSAAPEGSGTLGIRNT